MSQRHPLLTLGLLWLATVAVLGLLVVCERQTAQPAPVEVPPTATPVIVVVTATPTAHAIGPVLPTRTPQPPIILDALPMATVTPRPTRTPTVLPTATPTPDVTRVPARPPVQKG